jgi:hypothetical protein
MSLNMDDEKSQKAAFAAFYISEPQNHQGAFAAALKLFPSDRERGKACQVSFSWPNDPEVIAEIERIKETTEYEDPDLPSKKKLIQMALDVYKNEYTSAKEKNSAIKLIADLQGFIVKAESGADLKRMPTMPVYKVVSE